MRIGIDASCWMNRRGYGRFTRCLVAEMVARNPRHELVLILDEPSTARAALPEGVEVRTIRVSEAPATAASAHGHRKLRDVLRMSLGASRAGCDVFFFPSVFSFYPVFGTPLVVTIHDAIAAKLPHLVLPSVRSRFLWHLKQRGAIRSAKAVLTVSDTSRQALVDVLSVPEERVFVIREAPAPVFRPTPDPDVLRRYGIGPKDRCFLYVGGISPHKNLTTLIEAFGLLDPDPNLRLLLVGDTERDRFLSDTDAVRRAIARSPASDRIELTGYVTDDDLAALYTGAVATVLPSLGEGFGLPAAESAACGTPVVASADPALMELLGDAGLYAEACDVSGFAAHLRRLLAEPRWREQVGLACLTRAARSSWGEAAERTIELLERVGSGGG